MLKQFKYLGAVVYDCFIVLMLLVFATVILLLFRHGAAIQNGNLAYQLYLISILYAYYVGSWYFRGATIGMLPWRLTITSVQKQPLTLQRASLRFFVGVFSLGFLGFGFFWALVDKQKKTLQDKLCRTRIE